MAFGKKINAKSIMDIVEDTAENSALSSIVLFHLVEKAWNEIVGEYIAKHSIIKKLEKGILKIAAESAPVRSEILMRQNSIITAINNKLEKDIIKEITLI